MKKYMLCIFVSTVYTSNVVGYDEGNSVILFKHCNYGGSNIKLKPGRYDLFDLAFEGVTNDDISSVVVPEGYQITLFEHDDFQGRSLTLSTNNNCLVNNRFNDILSSVIVTKSKIKNNQYITQYKRSKNNVVAYQHCNFSGYNVVLKPGLYNLGRLRKLGIRNDDISSFRVPSNYSITLYEHDNFQGRSISLQSNDTCLVDNNFNDKLSSIVVKKHGSSLSNNNGYHSSGFNFNQPRYTYNNKNYLKKNNTEFQDNNFRQLISQTDYCLVPPSSPSIKLVGMRPKRGYCFGHWKMTAQGELRPSKFPKYCLEFGQLHEYGSHAYITACSGSIYQQWRWNNGIIRSKANSNLVLDYSDTLSLWVKQYKSSSEQRFYWGNSK